LFDSLFLIDSFKSFVMIFQNLVEMLKFE
jgi:hypothetical protein